MKNKLFDLKGQVGIVTGASRGLGRMMANALAGAGMNVAVTSRTLDSLKPVVKELEAKGVKALPVRLDVTKPSDIQRMARTVLEEFGRVDALVNNAGLNIRKPALDVSWDDYDTVLGTNLKGAFFCAKALAPAMMSRGYGRIVNIGSCTSVFGMSGIAPYVTSRAGALGLTRALAVEWAPCGVTVNLLAPGWFRTAQNDELFRNETWAKMIRERIPAGRFGQEGDLDGIIVFLCSPASRYMTGQIVLVDGGFTTGATKAIAEA
ncbi:MAG: SDR family oxidoreductase [Planctomycetota bacterium]